MISRVQFIEQLRPVLQTGSSKQQVQALWAVVKFSRAGPAAGDAFLQLAIDAGLIDQRGHWVSTDIAEHRHPYGLQDIEHVIAWGLRGWNPFEHGALT